jgi:hypothetical protein
MVSTFAGTHGANGVLCDTTLAPDFNCLSNRGISFALAIGSRKTVTTSADE